MVAQPSVTYSQDIIETQKRVINALRSENEALRSEKQFKDRLLSNPHLSANRKVLWIKLNDHLNAFSPDEQGRTWVDMGYLAKQAGCSAKQVGREIAYFDEHVGNFKRHEVSDPHDLQRKRILIEPTDLTWTSCPDEVKPDVPNNHGGAPDRLPCQCGCTIRKVTRNRKEECAACGELLHDGETSVQYLDYATGTPKVVHPDNMSHKGTPITATPGVVESFLCDEEEIEAEIVESDHLEVGLGSL